MASKLLFVAIILAIANAAPINYVSLLDQFSSGSTSNFLFRGGNPVGAVGTSYAFQYDQLVSQMKDIATLPETFTMVVFNFMDPTNALERGSIQLEQYYWATHPGKGRTVVFTLRGASLNPYEATVDQRTRWSKNIQSVTDNLPALLEQVRSVLTDTTAGNTVVYVHCECGCDRTGEFSAAYAMQYLGVSLADARNTNVRLINRDMIDPNEFGMTWFCYHLKYEKSYPLTCSLLESGSTTFPQCETYVYQEKTSYWKQGNSYYSQWNVKLTNINPTSPQPFVIIAAYQFKSGIQSMWGASYNSTPGASSAVVLPSYQGTKLGAGQVYEFGYIKKDVNPMYMIAYYPEICQLMLQPYPWPTPDYKCSLTASQSIVASWNNNGEDYIQVKGVISNPADAQTIFYLNVTMSGSGSIESVWNLESTGTPNVYKLPDWSSGIAANSNFEFGYNAKNTAAPFATVLTTGNFELFPTVYTCGL